MYVKDKILNDGLGGFSDWNAYISWKKISQARDLLYDQKESSLNTH